MKVNIYTDGAAKGNPGPGGYGVVLIYKNNILLLPLRQLLKARDSLLFKPSICNLIPNFYP